jgi:choline dehydrogenase-like flavoprotein
MELRGSDYDWGYKTTLVRRDDYERIEKPNTRGKVLGGSSSLNYFTWVPGCKPTFDRWAEFGGQEWTWDPLIHYLRKSATYHDDLGLYSKDLQKVGKGGPLPVSHAELLDEFADFRDRVSKAWVSRGHKIQENIYDGEMIGLTHCLDTIYKGQRSGSYLFVKNKPNITILAYTHAKNIIIDAGLTAKGVVVIGPNGGEQSFYATREVIVSEGVFESPKLLMLSGIGPRDQLERYGIRTLVESNHVGQNLIDHPGVPFVLQVKDGYGADDHLLRQSSKFSAAAETYKKNRTGPKASGLLELVGFPRIDDYFQKDPLYKERKAANGGKDPFSPEGQPHFELDFVCMFGSAFQWHFPTPKKGNHITVVVDLVRPVSGPGEVTLQSNDPLVQPAINLNFFADDLDIVGMREGIRFSYDVLTKGEGFKDIVVAEYPWDMPLDDDKQMERAVLDRCQTAFHPTGTCRLSKNIGQGVVDPKLKVHGVKNLRVIDASVIPIIPDCRIQNSVYAIGEKGADMIKDAHKDLYA